MVKKTEVFFKELGLTFIGLYTEGTPEVLYPVDNAHPGDSADFEINKVTFEYFFNGGECMTVDITTLFFQLEGWGINIEQFREEIIIKIEG